MRVGTSRSAPCAASAPRLLLHFHTHDTSGISAASVLAAINAGCDAVDGAMDAMSGLTSQPNLGSIAAALQGSARDPGMPRQAMFAVSEYWEGVRRYYAPFEADRPITNQVHSCWVHAYRLHHLL